MGLKPERARRSSELDGPPTTKPRTLYPFRPISTRSIYKTEEVDQAAGVHGGVLQEEKALVGRGSRVFQKSNRDLNLSLNLNLNICLNLNLISSRRDPSFDVETGPLDS